MIMNTKPEDQDLLTQLREKALRQRLEVHAQEYQLTRTEDLWQLDASLRGVSSQFTIPKHQIAAYRAQLGLKPLKEAKKPKQHPTLNLQG